jgi:hypothetical protein
MTNRNINTLRSLVETGLYAIAFMSLVRRIGPRRIVRIAALATEGYVDNARRGRRRVPRKKRL